MYSHRTDKVSITSPTRSHQYKFEMCVCAHLWCVLCVLCLLPTAAHVPSAPVPPLPGMEGAKSNAWNTMSRLLQSPASTAHQAASDLCFFLPTRNHRQQRRLPRAVPSCPLPSSSPIAASSLSGTHLHSGKRVPDFISIIHQRVQAEESRRE